MRGALRIAARRCAAAVPTILVVALAAFALLEAAPGDAVDAYLAQVGGDAGFAAELRARLGLADSLPGRLAGVLGRLASLDLGMSAAFARPVVEVIAERLPNTLLLMAGAASVAAGLGVAIGLLSGARPGGARDALLSTGALALLAMPNFWLALVLVLVFAVQLGWLPTGGIRTIGGAPPGGAVLDALRHLVLPSIALGAGYAAMFARTLRAGMVEAWHADHVRAAHARGLRRRAIVWRAVARPALAPVLVLLGQHVGTLVGGSVVVETVFAVPGMGRLAFEAVSGRDTLLLAGILLCATCVVLVANLLVDLALARLDPRIGQSDG